MADIQIFNAVLAAAAAPSDPFVILEERVTLEIDLVVTVAGVVTWWIEFTRLSPVAAQWYREVSEDNAGAGAVSMPVVLRTLQANGGGNFGIGTHRVSIPLVRSQKLARIQIATPTAGAGITATVTAVNAQSART